jgi:DNA-binding CsgD family transcriptional regulator
MLAGGNLSNHQMAQHLGVSVRTVETHLHRVYMKLGLSGRAELVSMWHDGLRTGEQART